MATSDAQKRATQKYINGNTNSISLRFYPKDKDIYDWLKSQDETAKQIIFRLLRQEMERK